MCNSVPKTVFEKPLAGIPFLCIAWLVISFERMIL